MSNKVPACPQYAERFRCIGSECEDTCCKEWTIPVDRATYEKYGALPSGPLRTAIEACVTIRPEVEGEEKPSSQYASIRLDDANRCPMLSADGLCRIQSECGADFLSHTCATYPKIVHLLGKVEDVALTLSCPEAARLVLFDPQLMRTDDPAAFDPEPPPTELNAEGESAVNLRDWFWTIRKAAFALVLNRSYPLWQRLFLLSIYCRRLDLIATGELKRSVPDFMRDFDATVVSGALRTAMDSLPVDGNGQLDVVLRLAGMLLNRSYRGPRFIECVQAFTTGIGNGPAATLESLSGQYQWVHDHYYAPYFERHPYILENYLINTMVRCEFPFGREGMQPGATPNLTRECTTLIAQFTLMKGLLIGVAGFHGEKFAAEHVVHTVQAASRHFEHHPEFLKMSHALLVESQMDGARGMAILLQNAAPREAQSVRQSVPVGVAQGTRQ